MPRNRWRECCGNIKCGPEVASFFLKSRTPNGAPAARSLRGGKGRRRDPYPLFRPSAYALRDAANFTQFRAFFRVILAALLSAATA
jgi:hypothetical protein